MFKTAGALAIVRDAEHGLVTGTTLGSTVETHDYTDFGEPSRQTATVNSTQVFDVQIARDPLGRIAQRIEVVDGITRVFQYGYDLAGRLENVTRNGDLVVHYTYDANGNRLSADGQAGLVTGTYDDQDRLLTYGGASYTYTANGELATKTAGGQTTTYAYDPLGNLIQVTKPNGDVITYIVDGRGRRVGKSVNGTRVKGWLYADQLRPVAELDGDGNVISRFVYGTKPNAPEYLIRGGVTYRIFSDHLGSPRVIVDATTGAIVQRMDFHVFGEIIQDSNPGWQPFGFAGGLYDVDTALSRFGARDFDATSGRWLTKDPIGLAGGDANLYAYVQNDSLNNIDPEGLEIFPKGVPLPNPILSVTPTRPQWQALQEAHFPGLKGTDDAADAFRHCLASCDVTATLGDGAAKFMGWLNEAINSTNDDSRRMDEANNACGRKLGRNVSAGPGRQQGCAQQCLSAVQNGSLRVKP